MSNPHPSRTVDEMDALSIQMLGGLQVHRNGVEVPAFATRKATALFCCIVLNRADSLHREVLCARLWGDQPDRSAHKSLRNALWRVRRVIEPSSQVAEQYLKIDAHRVRFQPNAHTVVDVWEFLDVAERFDPVPLDRELTDAEFADIDRATSLYRGRLLDGESIIDEATIVEAERVDLLQIALLERLMLHHRRHENWRSAASTGLHILRLDNCREHVHREIMACHLATGDRPAAIRQFDACSHVLARELGIGPMRETLELNHRIRNGECCPTSLDGLLAAPIGAAWA